MNERLADGLGRIERAQGVETLIRTFDAISGNYGGIGFVASAWDTADHSRLLLYASMREPFWALDAQGPWWSDDPVLARLATGIARPFSYEECWKDPLPSAAPRWEALVAAGLAHGMVFPTSRTPYAGGVLVFTKEADIENLTNHREELHLIATYFHAAVVDCAPAPGNGGVIRNTLMTEEMLGRRFKLSDREITCLRWIALGKTAQDIAEIEGLSVHTVRSYLRNGMEKLNASTQAQAIAHGIKYGLLRM